MSNPALKTPLQFESHELAKRRIYEAMQQTGKGLPCSVAKVVSSNVVAVKFELDTLYTLPQVTLPVASAQYIRLPLQAGDIGCTVATDAQVASLTGLGSGVADLGRVGNLACLHFVPLGSTKLFSVDGNVLTLYGPNGVTIEDQNKQAVWTLTPTGVTLTIGAAKFTFDNQGNFTASGNVTAGQGTGDQVEVQHHIHSGVQPGGSDTGPPVAGT
jgi:GpV Apex motif